MSAKILITGGAGFTGLNLIRYLLNRHPDYKIINFDKTQETAELYRLSSLEGNLNYIYVNGDISLEKDVKNVFDEYRPDYVIHLAALSYLDGNISNPGMFVVTNVIGTQNILFNMRDKEIKRMLHISTSKVYGTSKYAEGNIDENRIMKPCNPYVASKAAADLFIQTAFRRYKLNVNILRPTNVYGPYQLLEKLIPTIIESIKGSKEIPIFGSLDTIRDWIYIDDFCEAIDLALHHGISGETYNISYGESIQSLDLVRIIGRLMNTKEPRIVQLKERLEDDSYPSISSEKIRSQLGWKPLVNLEEGLKKTISWYQQHSDWVKEAYTNFY